MGFSKLLLLGVFSCFYLAASAQVGVDYDLVKPKKFEDRVLASENSNNGKKFKKSRRFIQNTITHYNYYFNANEKLKMIVARAKAAYREDYAHLLSFYNYSLDATAAQKRDLDSVIYKCDAGILIHDTRNDWIDNLYLLIGKTYYFKKDFDSAYITLQFLNWAFAPRDKDAYYLPIGSNENEMQGNNANVVSTKEHPNLLQKTFSLPPSRNDGLVWKIRNYIAQDKYTEAASLIQIMLHDPQFPPRLVPSLMEVRALWFYQQNIYDSAAFFLEKALPAAETHEEAARWEYLIAQLYERDSNTYMARTFYERTVNHTYNPVLEVYARLNTIRQNKEGGADFIARNIEALVKMAHRGRYELYRDIIYYTAAQMELERHNTPGAVAFLRLCIKYSVGSPNNQRNKAFLQLANLSFESKDYRPAKNFYDSLNVNGPDAPSLGDLSWLPGRKAALSTIVRYLDVVDRQDSLQRIAALPPAQRDAYIKKLVRFLRRQQGLRDEMDSSFNNGQLKGNSNVVPDMFSSGAASDWYFDNATLKAKGYSDFRSKWGNRPNVDNWQISSMMRLSLTTRPRSTPDLSDSASRTVVVTTLDFKSLLNNLPLTPEKLKPSNDSIESAMFGLGKTYQDGLTDYPYAIKAYDSLLGKFPQTRHREETLFQLYFCYKQIGDEDNARRILALLSEQYPKSPYTGRILHPDTVGLAERTLRDNATARYEEIYGTFIEGRFDDALAMKKSADSLYGDKYWTPQLLYIESVYFLHTRQDPQARAVLASIVAKWPKTPMADKAATMLDVLGRRRQIEDYLAKLQVTRAKDDDELIDTANAKPRPVDNRPRLTRNDSNMLKLDTTSDWARAKQREKALANVPGIQLSTDSATLQKLRADSAQLAAKLRTRNSVFSLTPDKPHAVIMVMDKVDPVYVNEAGNAFGGYNTENFYSLGLTTQTASLSDSLKLLIIGSFSNADGAMEYLRNAKGMAPRAIIPWMPAGRYTFLIISAPNLELLLKNKDMPGYRQFLSAAYPGKF